MSFRPRPVIYIRAGSGGREAAQAQEAAVRGALRRAGIAHDEMHVYVDIDTPGTRLGAALGALIEEASWGPIGTVYLRNVARLGHKYELLLRVVASLEGAGARFVTVEELDFGALPAARRCATHARTRGRVTLALGAAASTERNCPA